MSDSPGFREIAVRLLHHLNQRVRRGELTERGLARLTGYSQPHIHNVLKGARMVGMDLADQVMTLLDIPLISLLTQEELAGRAPPEIASGVPLPVLDGYLGGGASYPRLSATVERRFFPASVLSRLISPVLARVHVAEKSMWPLIWPQDLLLLDRSPPRTPPTDIRRGVRAFLGEEGSPGPLPSRGAGPGGRRGRAGGPSPHLEADLPREPKYPRRCAGEGRLAGTRTRGPGVRPCVEPCLAPDLRSLESLPVIPRLQRQRRGCWGSGTAAGRTPGAPQRCDQRCRPGWPRSSPRPDRC